MLDGQTIAQNITTKKFKLIEKKKTFLTAIKKDVATTPV